ncbi:hypothetical protein ACNS7O_05885 [Haloferacaceae archaeon DSL9]
MQRRAVAVSVAFFLILSTASYSLIATADEPEIEIENADFELSEGDEFEIDGQTYNVTSLGSEEGDEGGTEFSGEIVWTVQNAEFQETWENESTVEYQGAEWTVVIEGENPSSFTLEPTGDAAGDGESAEEGDDPAAEDEATDAPGGGGDAAEEPGAGEGDGGDGAEEGNGNTTQEGDGNTTQEDGAEDGADGNQTEAPAGPQQFSDGDTIEYNGEQATVSNVTVEGVIVTWQADSEESASFSDGETITLAGGDEYIVAFADEDTIYLTDDQEAYQAQVDEISQFDQRIEGLWYVVVLTGAISFFLVALAFLPPRY